MKIKDFKKLVKELVEHEVASQKEQILKEITTNRVELLNELRSEIKLLARTIASSSKSPD